MAVSLNRNTTAVYCFVLFSEKEKKKKKVFSDTSHPMKNLQDETKINYYK